MRSAKIYFKLGPFVSKSKADYKDRVFIWCKKDVNCFHQCRMAISSV